MVHGTVDTSNYMYMAQWTPQTTCTWHSGHLKLHVHGTVDTSNYMYMVCVCVCVCVFYGSFFALFLCFFCLIFFLISYIVYYKCDCSWHSGHLKLHVHGTVDASNYMVHGTVDTSNYMYMAQWTPQTTWYMAQWTPQTTCTWHSGHSLESYDRGNSLLVFTTIAGQR